MKNTLALPYNRGNARKTPFEGAESTNHCFDMTDVFRTASTGLVNLDYLRHLTLSRSCQCSGVFGKKWNPQILVNSRVTDVPRCVSRSANRLALRTWLRAADLQMGHHRTDELLVRQRLFSDRQGTFSITEGRANYVQYLSCLSSNLIGVCHSSQLRIGAFSTHFIGCPKNKTDHGLWMRLAVFAKTTAVLLEIFQSLGGTFTVPRGDSSSP